MNMAQTPEVVVVGAGPASSWAAFRLARAGIRVVLVDGSHPREKPCGGGVTGRALALVDGAINAAQLPSRRITAARFVDTTSDGRPQSIAVPLDDDALVVASRMEFDGLLLAAACQAGAELIRARALDVTSTAGGFVVHTGESRIAAQRLIGADGANSLVRRRLARPFPRADLSIATGFFAQGATSGDVIVELAADPPGYMWSFPRPGHLAVGICAQADAGVTASDLRGRARRWIYQMGLDPGARLEPYSWPIPSLTADGYRSLTVSGPGWFLTGDAAGLVDPITREGIYFALRSAEFAAQASASAVAPEQASRVYRERVHDEITSDLAVAAKYKTGFFRPHFARLLIDALRESAEVRAIMADLIAGRRAYTTLKWSLLGTGEFGLAWRLLTSA